jgi:hypothetical protein
MKEEGRRVDDAYYSYLELPDISFYLTFLPKGRFQILETVSPISLGLKPVSYGSVLPKLLYL